VDSDRSANAVSDSVFIGFPVRCHYRGGHRALGRHGVHLWIRDGRIGFGELRLTHWIPLSDVSSVDVKERQVGGSEGMVLMAQGLGFSGMGGGRGPKASFPKLMTDVTVRTKDRQEALWVVEERGGDWVRARLTRVLRKQDIPYYDDLPPGERATYP
jgi:hypothetical protein